MSAAAHPDDALTTPEWTATYGCQTPAEFDLGPKWRIPSDNRPRRSYDEAGRLKTTTLPSGSGHVETRADDNAGRLTQLKEREGATLFVVSH